MSARERVLLFLECEQLATMDPLHSSKYTNLLRRVMLSCPYSISYTHLCSVAHTHTHTQTQHPSTHNQFYMHHHKHQHILYEFVNCSVFEYPNTVHLKICLVNDLMILMMMMIDGACLFVNTRRAFCQSRHMLSK